MEPRPAEPRPAETPYPAEIRYAAPPPPAARRGPFERTPFLAALLSVIPGLGHVYNGLYTRAFVFALIYFGLLGVMIANDGGPVIAVIAPALVFFWFFNLIDAYRQAVLINYGYTPDSELSDTLGPLRGSGGLVLGAVIFLLGLIGLVQHLFPDLDLSRLFELWYVPFLLCGGWLFYRALADRRKRTEETDDWTSGPTGPTSEGSDKSDESDV